MCINHISGPRQCGRLPQAPLMAPGPTAAAAAVCLL